MKGLSKYFSLFPKNLCQGNSLYIKSLCGKPSLNAAFMFNAPLERAALIVYAEEFLTTTKQKVSLAKQKHGKRAEAGDIRKWMSAQTAASVQSSSTLTMFAWTAIKPDHSYVMHMLQSICLTNYAHAHITYLLWVPEFPFLKPCTAVLWDVIFTAINANGLL